MQYNVYLGVVFGSKHDTGLLQTFFGWKPLAEPVWRLGPEATRYHGWLHQFHICTRQSVALPWLGGWLPLSVLLPAVSGMSLTHRATYMQGYSHTGLLTCRPRTTGVFYIDKYASDGSLLLHHTGCRWCLLLHHNGCHWLLLLHNIG